MEQAVNLLANIAYYLLSAVELLLFLRAVLSWFLSEEDNRFMYMIVVMSEPFLIPFRLILDRVERNRAIPIDFSMLFAMVTVMLVQTLLSFLV